MGRVLDILSNVAAVRLKRELKCAACGRDFTCGASLKGCWCSEIELTAEARTRFRQLYDDCLCRECLEQSAAIATETNG